jgi:glutathione S-transferase
MMLTIYGRATSSNVQAVMWTVGELGLAHERLDYGHVHGGLDTPAFRAMNPHGLIPVLVDGDGPPIWESAAIVRYLGARYGSEPFWPADPLARSQADMWAEWGKTTLARSFTEPVFWAVVRTPAAKRDGAALARALKRLEAVLDRLEARLDASPFVGGRSFSFADILVGHVLYRYFDIDIPRPPRPALERYYAALSVRPAFREHVAVSYESLRAE